MGFFSFSMTTKITESISRHNRAVSSAIKKIFDSFRVQFFLIARVISRLCVNSELP